MENKKDYLDDLINNKSAVPGWIKKALILFLIFFIVSIVIGFITTLPN